MQWWNLSRCLIALINLTLIGDPIAMGQDISTPSVQPGIQPKLAAGAGTTVSRGPASTFYNPANIIFTKHFEPDVDVSYSQISYTYLPLNNDSYSSSTAIVATPNATLGGTFRPIPPLALSVALVPLGLSANYLMLAVPYEVGSGTYTVSDIQYTTSGQMIAAGAAYKVMPIFTLGVGLINIAEKNTLTAYKVDAEGPYMDIVYSGSFNQFVGGVRIDLMNQKLSLAGSYKTAVSKTYSGDSLLDLKTKNPTTYAATDATGYSPGVLGLGLEYQMGMFGGFGELNYKQWSSGRTLVRRGVNTTPLVTDYTDSFDVSVGAKVWPLKNHMVIGAVGIKTPNVGDGTALSQNSDGAIQGFTLGNIDGIQRFVVSGGYRFRFPGHGYAMVGGQYQTGSRVVPEGFALEGTHTVSMFSGSLGGAYGF